MSEADLIPITSTARAKELGSRGGRVKSPAKKIAAKIRELKKQGLTDKNAQKLYELMTDPDLTDFDLLLLLQAARTEAKNFRERVEASKLLMEWRKLHHGTSSSLNIDATMKSINLSLTGELDAQRVIEIAQRVKAKKLLEAQNGHGGG